MKGRCFRQILLNRYLTRNVQLVYYFSQLRFECLIDTVRDLHAITATSVTYCDFTNTSNDIESSRYNIATNWYQSMLLP